MELKEAEQPSEVLNQILGFEKPVQTVQNVIKLIKQI